MYTSWKNDACLSSISGGTDVIGCFVGANSIGPVYAGECQKRHLGMDVQVFDGTGKALVGFFQLVYTYRNPSSDNGDPVENSVLNFEKS